MCSTTAFSRAVQLSTAPCRPSIGAQLLTRQARSESNTRAGRREHQGRPPDDLRLDLTIGKDAFYEVVFSSQLHVFFY
jgi:hypothetical protein